MSDPSSSVFSPLIEQAIELSAQWHDQTYRKKRWREAAFEVPKDTVLRVPVMAHVTTVAMTVQRAGWDEATVAAAFLHDVLEDANRFGRRLREDELRAVLGEEVVRRVRQVTEQHLDVHNRPVPWRHRKEAYIRQIRMGFAEAAAISLADKLHNLWTINQAVKGGVDVFVGDEQGRGLSAGAEEQLWFYTAVLEATERFEDARLGPLRERLVKEIGAFEKTI